VKIEENLYFVPSRRCLKIKYVLPSVGRKLLDKLLKKGLLKGKRKFGLSAKKQDVDDLLNSVKILPLNPRSFFVVEKGLNKYVNASLDRAENKHGYVAKKARMVSGDLSKNEDGTFSITAVFEAEVKG